MNFPVETTLLIFGFLPEPNIEDLRVVSRRYNDFVVAHEKRLYRTPVSDYRPNLRSATQYCIHVIILRNNSVKFA